MHQNKQVGGAFVCCVRQSARGGVQASDVSTTAPRVGKSRLDDEEGAAGGSAVSCRACYAKMAPLTTLASRIRTKGGGKKKTPKQTCESSR